jgi:raffinose/stachyose/melibiose transport system substrate-binding protein
MPVAAGSAEWKPATEWHVSWVWNTFAGPQALYEGLTGKRPWTDPVFVDAITAMKSWWDQGWFGGSTDRYFTNKFGPLYSDLASGKAAMMVTGTWAFTEIGAYFGDAAHNTAEWDWAPLPSMSSGVAPAVFPLSVGGVYGINSKCASPAQAAEFIDFLISNPQRQTAALGAIGHEPSPIKLSSGDFPTTVDPRLKRAYVDLGASTNVGYTTWTFWPAKSDTYIYTEMDKVLTGQTTPQQYCAGLNTIFQTELKTGKNPAVPSPLGA